MPCTNYGKRVLPGVDRIIVHVSRDHARTIRGHDREIDGTDLSLAHLHKENGCAVDDTLEHRDDHGKQEDGEDTDPDGVGTSALVSSQVADNTNTSRCAFPLLDFSFDFFKELLFRYSH